MTIEVTKRPYAGQSWAPGLMSAGPVWGLGILSNDLRVDVRTQGVTGDIELWAKATGEKGFFVGDTSSLADEGWTKVITL